MLRTIVRSALLGAAALAIGFAAELSAPAGFFIGSAEAVIGRPLTPLSYAGVARRTTRRAIYATSVYVATLPRGCTTIVVEGVALHQCGVTYYQPVGGRYVVVRVE
jgi:hypothetical protein